MIKIPVFLLCTKVILFAATFAVFYFISNPYPACWNSKNLPENLSIDDPLVHRIDSGETCVKTKLFDNFMCAGDPWSNPWWSVNITNPARFCIARTSTYMALFLQLCLICIVQLLHLAFLTKRSFSNYDPLDMIPAFLTISALSSVLIIQIMLFSNWDDLWENSKQPIPSTPLPHNLLTCIISAGIIVAAIDWVLYHWIYNAEQDLIEERVRAAANGLSDKEHEE